MNTMLSVGELLHRERIKKNISLPQAQKGTRLRGRYLKAIEENDWGIFSSRVYITGAIRSYASFLNIDPEKAIAYFRRDYVKTERITFRKRLPRLQFLPETKKILIVIFSSIFIVFLIYFSYQVYIFISPPEVLITSPSKRIFRNVDRITIIGQTEKEATITIFEKEVFPDQSGIFRYEFPLIKGTNKITIDVEGANGKHTEVNESFILE